MIKRIAGLSVFIASLAFAAVCVAAGAGPGQDINALISRLNAHYTGFENTMESVEIHNHVTGPSGNVRAEQVVYWKGRKLRIESGPMQQAGKAFKPEELFVYNGKEAWMFSPEGKRRLTGKDLEDFEAGRNWWWTTITPASKITGRETVNGMDCYVVESPSGRRMWIDKDALVIVKSESPGPQGKVSNIIYSDFRDVKGWKVPFRQETFAGGQKVSISITDSFEAGKELSDNLFEPSSVKDY